MFGFFRASAVWTLWPLGVVLALVLSACGSKSLNRAPVEDRKTVLGGRSSGVDARSGSPKQSAGLENAGKAGYYIVKPQDTLLHIGLETGQSHKDIARWNNLEDSNKIEVGQVLRVAPPLANDSVAVVKPVATGALNSTPLAAASPAPVKSSSTPVASTPVASATPGTNDASSVTKAPVATGLSAAEEDLGWTWPSSGAVIAGFDDVKNKGLDIAGSSGDPVLAAADGKVVYADSGLRGYGKLVILKHNNIFLTAYAHNRNLLVKDDQLVKKGQKIAEMGNTDADRVKLHFEVRRQGKPVDPAKYLPPR